jgi:hypothetical protein
LDIKKLESELKYNLNKYNINDDFDYDDDDFDYNDQNNHEKLKNLRKNKIEKIEKELKNKKILFDKLTDKMNFYEIDSYYKSFKKIEENGCFNKIYVIHGINIYDDDDFLLACNYGQLELVDDDDFLLACNYGQLELVEEILSTMLCKNHKFSFYLEEIDKLFFTIIKKYVKEFCEKNNIEFKKRYGGGLMQLLVYGAQDVYLTRNQ